MGEVKKDINQEANDLLDIFQSIMAEEPQIDCPLVHTFTNGLYSRQITMPSDSVIISQVHKTQHQFVVLKGIVDVYNVEDGSLVTIKAPYSGVTEPGTRRLLYVHEETVWTTFHATDKTTAEDAEEEIVDKRQVLSFNDLKLLLQ